jgi:hypothetical protein
MLTLCAFGRVRGQQEDSPFSVERKGLLDPRGSDNGKASHLKQEGQARENFESEESSIFEKLACCRRTISGKCKKVFCCPEEDSDGAQLHDRPSQNRFSPSRAMGSSLAVTDETRFGGNAGGIIATSKDEPVLSIPPVPKLDLSAARNSSNSAASAAAGYGGVASASNFEEAQTSARSFGEDFDIQPPAPNRRDMMERLRALREQIPAPSNGGISESPAPASSASTTRTTPNSASRYRQSDDYPSQHRLSADDFDYSKSELPRPVTEHFSAARSTALGASPTAVEHGAPDLAGGAAAASAHRTSGESSPAERPGLVGGPAAATSGEARQRARRPEARSESSCLQRAVILC